MKKVHRVSLGILSVLFVLFVSAAWADSPTARIDFAMAPYPPGGGVLMHGGWSDATNWHPSSEVWKFDSTGWTSVSGSGAPAFSHHSMTYDSARQVIVLCGVPENASGQYQTWEYNGASWTQGPDVPVGISGDVEVAYDAGRGVTVLYGADPGWATTQGAPETWEYNGTNWTQKSYSQNPVSCGDGALLAYDAVLGKVVLVGNPNNPYTNAQTGTETWTWDGSSWSQVGGTQPENAVLGGLAYDSGRQQLVLLTTDMSTWVFNGTAWTQLTPATSPTPTPNSYFNMAYDAAMGKIVMFGGESYSNSTLSYPTTTWLWDGTTWAAFSAGSGQPSASHPSLDTSLNIIAPSVELSGTCYQATFNRYTNPADPMNLYWVLNLGSVAASVVGCDGYSATLDPTTLQLSTPYIELQQVYYQATFTFSPNAADPTNLYWRLDLSSLATR